MEKILITIRSVMLVLCLAAGHAAWAENYLQEPYDIAAEPGDTLFTDDELDDLLAPIALYPDPLLAQILPASTFIDQIDEAARYVRQYGNSARIDDQPWDVSVKAVAHYPDVLFMMDQKYDWTVSLGQAYINQPQDVMDAIQRLRAEAQSVGNLASSPQQQVIIENEIIRIIPAEPVVIYVPQYDPVVVYVERPYPSYGFITFGIGFTIGAWLNRDCDWHEHRVYYHGWRGGGWISRARPHIRVRNNIYINNNYRVININRRVLQHDTAPFRSDIRRDVQLRRARIGRPAPQGREQRPLDKGLNRGAPPRTATPAPPSAPVTRPPERPENKDIYRGREIRGAQPAPYSGYGGYGSSKDAKTYRERGQSSRENMQQFNRQQQPVRGERPASTPRTVPKQALEPAPRATPEQRPGISGGNKPAPRPAVRPVTPQTRPSNRGEKEQRQQR